MNQNKRVANVIPSQEYDNSTMMNLEEFRVAELPGTVFYIPDVVSVSEESLLLDRISKTPKTKWTQLRNRRLQNWGGMPHPKGMIPEQMPDWLEVNTNC